MRIQEYPEGSEHRYILEVHELKLDGSPDRGRVVFIMRNPATLSERRGRNHATRNKCISFARQWGFGTMVEVNLFSRRAGNRRQLFKENNILEDENDVVLKDAVANANLIVVAWGTMNGPGHVQMRERVKEVRRILQPWNNQLFCLGINEDGSPKQPLFRGPTLHPWQGCP